MTRRHRAALLALLALLAAGLLAPAAGEIQGAAAWVRVKNLLTPGSCATAGPCDLAAGTTIGGAAIGSGSGSATALDQSAGETDLRYDATLEAYYYDTDGGGSRATNGTEPFVDVLTVEVPLDFATIQDALDSDDIKKGSTANQGGIVRVGNGTRTESFEIGGTITTDFQFSTGVEGLGFAGFENGSSVAACATTLLGNDTASNTVAKVAGAIGWSIRNLCIDMNDAPTNDPAIGIHVGYSSAASVITKHGLIENVNIQSGSSSSIGIKLGDDTSGSDTAFNVIRNYRADDIGTALVINAQQTVGNRVEGMDCTHPTGTIGCVSIGANGGEIELHDIYVSPGAANQTGINVRNEALGALIMHRLNFEWSQATGTMVNFDATGNTGAHHAITISESRFQPQVDSSTPKCIDWNRVGHLNVIGNSFESGGTGRTCDIDLNNPSATLESTVFWAGNDVQWAGTQSDIVVNRTTSGGAIRVVVIEDGEIIVCNGAGTGITLASTGCYGLGPTGPDAADWDFADGLTAADLAAGSVGSSEADALDAGDTTTGTFADGRIDGSLEEDEIDLLDLRDSGTPTCIGSQVVRRNAGDTAWECATISAGGAPSTADYLVGTADGGLSAEIVFGAAVSNQWVTGVSGGAVTRSQPAFSNLSGTVSDTQIANDAIDGGSGGEIQDGTIDANDLATAVDPHPSVTLGPFYINDLPGTATTQATLGFFNTATALSRNAAADVKIQAAARVIGLFITSDAARTAGTATARVRIAGTGTTFNSGSVVLDATNTTSDTDMVAHASGLAVTAGQTVGCDVVTSSWTPITADLSCWVVVAYD